MNENQDNISSHPQSHQGRTIGESSASQTAASHVRDPEQEPLLPGNYVSPDDPIVSPLNLKKIQLLRFVSIAVFSINVVLFFGFLLSDFIAIPGLDSRGRSFLELDLVLICGLSNLLTLWCFDIPAYYERILGYISSGLLFINFFIVFSISYLRSQFGLIGELILLWAFGNFLFNSLVEYWVEEGRKYQEIKYTGRQETRRTVCELFVITIKTIVKLFMVLLIWNITFTLWVSAYDQTTKPWGEMVPVNNSDFKVHLACFGLDSHNSVSSNNDQSKKEKQPIILIEGGQLTSSEETSVWIEELFHLNKIDRYCIWDRPGYGFSDSSPSPTSMGIIIEYLIEALHAKGIEGPFTPVGFDSGGLYSRLFASRVPGSIHSLLFVDSWHENLLLKDPFKYSSKEENFKKVFKNILEPMNSFTGFKLWLKGIVSPLGLVTNFHWMFHPKKYSSNSRIYGKDMYWSPKYIRARLQEQVTSSIISYNEIAGSDIHDIPVSVISSDFMIKNSQNWGQWQRQLTKLSSNTLEWVVAENSGHWIWKSPKGKTQLQNVLLRLIGEEGNIK